MSLRLLKALISLALLSCKIDPDECLDYSREIEPSPFTIRFGDTGNELAVTLNRSEIVFSNRVRWAIYPPCQGIEYDFASVLSHELGHVGRLEHEANGIMKANIGPCEIRRACNLRELLSPSF